ncbi:MAG: ribonuclease III [Bacillota bacterium]|nr:ribonuclease III [Bacillota bacterium]
MTVKKTVETFLTDNELCFGDEGLMSLALIHPSYSQEQSSHVNNQRLEFLGDAVLDFVVADYLYQNYTEKAEGDLTQIRARVVCEKALVEIAQEIQVGKYILLGKGEDMSGGRTRKSILADTVEAIIGAIYLDQGIETARLFILKHLEEAIKKTAQGEYQDYKSRLQEIVQANSRENVRYEIIHESGPAHAKNFVAGVFFKDDLLQTGEGKSKKEAEQNAAEKALKDPGIEGYLHKESLV